MEEGLKSARDDSACHPKGLKQDNDGWMPEKVTSEHANSEAKGAKCSEARGVPKWTDEESRHLTEGVLLYGRNWIKVTEYVAGKASGSRTKEQVINHYYSMIWKLRRELASDAEGKAHVVKVIYGEES